MQTLFINSVQSEELLKAICRTFIHSLWQGLVFSLVAGLILLLTKRASPALRYNILSGILLLFILTTGVTFVLQFPDNAISGTPSTSLTSLTLNNSTAGSFSWQQFISWCDANAPLIMLVWFLVFAVKLLQLAGGLIRVKRIRNFGVSEPADYWKNRLTELAAKLKLTVSVTLKESALIQVPVVTGWLKPLVIVPAGLLTRLSADQIEAILLHELAHIRRQDYLVNLLQSLVETLFFFNPSVHWLSKLIREEREHCCDDLAIKEINNKSTYLRALVAFQEYSLEANSSIPALSFAESKYQLLDRVKRMIGNTNKNLNIAEKIFLTTSIFVLIAIAFVPVVKSQAQKYAWILPIPPKDSVVLPVTTVIPAVQPDYSLQHITAEPADTSITPVMRAEKQKEREAEQQARDEQQNVRNAVQATRDKVQVQREQQQKVREYEDSLRRISQRQIDAAAKFYEQQEQALEKDPDKRKNVSRNVAPTKPVKAVAPIPANQ